MSSWLLWHPAEFKDDGAHEFRGLINYILRRLPAKISLVYIKVHSMGNILAYLSLYCYNS